MALAFTAGLVTVGGPCVLPLLPVVLGTSSAGRHRLRPLAIVAGFSLSFALFALLFTVFGSFLGLSPATWRTVAAVAIIIFGVVMVLPRLQLRLFSGLERLLSKMCLPRLADQGSGGLKSGFLLGGSLGLLWTPCSGPVLASILALVIARQHLAQAGLLLLVFAIGAGIPMLLVAYGGQLATDKIKALAPHAGKMQLVFGGIIILVGIGLLTGWEAIARDWLYQQLPFLFIHGNGRMCVG